MDASKPILVVNCRACQSGAITSILNFGNMPLANRYLSSPDEPDITAPLEVVLCQNCGCVQLKDTVDPKVLFSEYLYTSSTSGSLADYFRKYARYTAWKLALKPEAFVVGIGGNDGVLELEYQRLGFKVLNVEPARNIANLSEANGVDTLNVWFDEVTAWDIVSLHGQADLITCNHCFAHMPDINGVVRGIKALLKPGGTFIFEEAYWPDMVAGNHFDQIYHEHVFYWTLAALVELFYRHDMTLVHAEFNASQGGSIRGFATKGICVTNKTVIDGMVKEIAAELCDLATYDGWNRRIMKWRTDCMNFLEPRLSVSCYGAPAKFTMLSEQLGFSHRWIKYAVEDSQIKVGRFTPGSHIPIVDRQHFIDHPTEHCIITAANYADMIVKANQQYRGKWVTLFPEPRFL